MPEIQTLAVKRKKRQQGAIDSAIDVNVAHTARKIKILRTEQMLDFLAKSGFGPFKTFESYAESSEVNRMIVSETDLRVLIDERTEKNGIWRKGVA